MAEWALCKCHNPDSCLLSLELPRDLSAFVWDQIVLELPCEFSHPPRIMLVLSSLPGYTEKESVLCEWYLQRWLLLCSCPSSFLRLGACWQEAADWDVSP